MKSIPSFHIKSLSEFHRLREFPKPEHPLVSVIELGSVNADFLSISGNMIFDFYCIALKHNFNLKVKHGQQPYDFDEGIMSFLAPGQVFRLEQDTAETGNKIAGWMILIHPDFLWNTNLAKNIKDYLFFGYSVNEALFLSEKEEATILEVMQNIRREYQTNIDRFSHDIILANLELLLNYTDRFYNRQFLTRKTDNHQILKRLETLLEEYFSQEKPGQLGMPTVQDISDKLNISRNYLSSLLKITTGRNTQQHILDKLVEIGKERISTTTLSVSEIAYELGFVHPQSFSRMFKTQTGLSPLAFRALFN
jgi:AraC family transcriptional activator of pobA